MAIEEPNLWSSSRPVVSPSSCARRCSSRRCSLWCKRSSFARLSEFFPFPSQSWSPPASLWWVNRLVSSVLVLCVRMLRFSVFASMLRPFPGLFHRAPPHGLSPASRGSAVWDASSVVNPSWSSPWSSKLSGGLRSSNDVLGREIRSAPLCTAVSGVVAPLVAGRLTRPVGPTGLGLVYGSPRLMIRGLDPL